MANKHHELEQLSTMVGKSKPLISFEIFPPRSNEGVEKLCKAITEFKQFAPAYISVTYGAGGTTKQKTYDIVKFIKNETDMIPAPHLTCVGTSRREIDEIAHQYLELGIKKIVALRGDMPGMVGEYQPHPDGYAYAADLVAALKEIADFDINVAAFPEGHPGAKSKESDLHYLKAKLDAGASKAITQYCFDTDEILRFIEKARKIGIDKPIVPGIILINNFSQLVNFSEKCGATVPSWLKNLFVSIDSEMATSSLALIVAANQCRILMNEGINEFHFYTLNRLDIIRPLYNILNLQS